MKVTKLTPELRQTLATQAEEKREKIQLTPLAGARPHLANQAEEWKTITKAGTISKRKLRRPQAKGVSFAVHVVELGRLVHIVKDGQLAIQYFVESDKELRKAIDRAKQLADGKTDIIEADLQIIQKLQTDRFHRGTSVMAYWANQTRAKSLRIRQGRTNKTRKARKTKEQIQAIKPKKKKQGKEQPKELVQHGKRVSGTIGDKRKKRKLRKEIAERNELYGRNPRR